MKYLVFGSMNIDKVYSMPSLPLQGQTLYCENFEVHVGGKGLNQALALSKTGAEVYIGGAIGSDGAYLKDYLDKTNVHTDFLVQKEGYTGHTIIEVDKNGQNQMILFSGANSAITEADCDEMLSHFDKGDLVLMQYETSMVEYMMQKAHDKGLTVAFNPSPFVDVLRDFDYSPVDLLILNESEGKSITGESEPEKICRALRNRMNGGLVVLTLGGDGAVFSSDEQYVFVPAFKVDAVDTTGAGDTFTGFFLSALQDGICKKDALKFASAASACVVQKAGAAETIPELSEVREFLKNHANEYRKTGD